jgi:endonuclease-3
MKIEERTKKILVILRRTYPEAKTPLRHENPFQLLVATILSAQCTDTQVNKVTPVLFKKFKKPADLAKADRSTLESMIRSTGFYKNKARSIRKCSAKLISDFSGKVPKTMEELTTLPGVGRKTANVVLGVCFDTPGIVVDTHVLRIGERLGLTKNKDAVKVEFDLQKLFPEKDWTRLSFLVQAHGRNCCYAKKPACNICPIATLCPSRNKFK